MSRGTAVVVVGLRVTGAALVEHFVRLGAPVTVIEDRPDAPTFPGHATAARDLGAVVLAAPDVSAVRAAVTTAHLVVPSPGIPPDHPALLAAGELGVPIRSEIDIASEIAQRAGRPVIGAVTGTNGKTTVTTLAAAMLAADGVSVGAAGNVGRALIEAVRDPSLDVVVAEVSSFQLAFTEVFRPRVAALLNLADDHLDWHGSSAAYAAAKARVFEHQRGDDVAVGNRDDATVAAIVHGCPRRLEFSIRPDAPTGVYRVHDDALVDPSDVTIVAIAEMTAALPHDLANALAATALSRELGGSLITAGETLRTFRRLPHRVQPVGEANGVRYLDDSKATNPHATRQALASFPSAVLIAGGVNKGLDLGDLRAGADHLRAVVTIGEAGDAVAAVFDGLTPVHPASSMHEAVHLASAAARPGDVVLLSPACASFDWYRDYAARGDDFAREVAALDGFTEGSG